MALLKEVCYVTGGGRHGLSAFRFCPLSSCLLLCLPAAIDPFGAARAHNPVLPEVALLVVLHSS